ncbi:MAG: hypothetical protein JKY50_00380 [Oleispira sp.]|nr:hypothetical protein [Oleispira sp.]
MMQRDKRKRKSPMLKELLKSKPNVKPRMQQAMNVFNSISRGRQYTGQTSSPLPLTEHDVMSYISIHGLTCYEGDILINIILALDNEWLTLDSARRKAEAKRG